MILLRHAESEFNVVYNISGVDPGIEDPKLTERGHHQAREVVAQLSDYSFDRILTSPYTRTLQTAKIVADALKLPITIEPEVRERGAFICDIGTPRDELARRWPAIDFSHIAELWWNQETESDDSVVVRATRFREAALDWPDHDRTLVITHWGFIRGLTGLSVKNCDVIPFDPSNPA